MKPQLLGLAAPVFAVVVILSVASPAEATIGRRRVVVNRPYFPPNRMPGWDWWRIYPYSPYNYGRNPYNPIVVPYYVNPVPVYNYSPAYTPPQTVPSYEGGVTYSPVSVSPTSTTGVVQLSLPDTFASVQFNGQPSSGVGSTRYYVVPMQPGQGYEYTVSANWTGNVGQPVSQARVVQVFADHTTVVNFNQPASKHVVYGR